MGFPEPTIPGIAPLKSEGLHPYWTAMVILEIGDVLCLGHEVFDTAKRTVWLYLSQTSDDMLVRAMRLSNKPICYDQNLWKYPKPVKPV